MTLEARIQAFVALGNFLKDPQNATTLEQWADIAHHQNSWFTPHHVAQSLQTIADNFLTISSLQNWANTYNIPSQASVSRKVGVVMAGNIPAVGFHDLLCVVMSGHTCVAKLSSQDTFLMQALIGQLQIIAPAIPIVIAEQLKEVEAIIATGSDNTARYFEYYFKNKPHIIRKNRSSVAILNGQETVEDFEALGYDITAYYGLGCRNISKLYVPTGYNFSPFYDTIESYGDIFLHHKYKNNYDYNKSIYLVNGIKHYDNGFLVLTQHESLVSPISVVFYEEYASLTELTSKIEQHSDKIQCIASKDAWFASSVAFGKTQKPSLTEYADSIDTMRFLMEEVK